MQKFLFLDLDDTVFQTLRKCGVTDGLEAAAYLIDATPISFSTPKQRSVLNCLGTHMTVIPTTARSLNAFRRVALPFGPRAILNFGGIILDEQGKPDETWLEQMRNEISPLQHELEHIQSLLTRFAAAEQMHVTVRIINDFGINFYVVVKDCSGNLANLRRLCTECIDPLLPTLTPAFSLWLNDNNLAVMPTVLNKGGAVKWLMEQLRHEFGDIISFGMGDSKSDADFMAACDYAIVPNHSQLHRFLFGEGHVQR